MFCESGEVIGDCCLDEWRIICMEGGVALRLCRPTY